MMSLEEFWKEWRSDSPELLVHTSGSTGKPKPMWVEKQRMRASARITCRFLHLQAGDTALLCLPLDYIAGKMMAVRADVWQLRLQSVAPSGHPLASIPEDAAPCFAAMVPMQVWNSLQDEQESRTLRNIHHLIIGGGAIDENLAESLADFPHAVWSTYGMTETLSHVALRRLNGPERSDWYTPFEGVTLSLTSEDCLAIDAPAVHEGMLETNDRAELLPDGRFRILGRRDNVICSGGIKIQIEEVEKALLPHLHLPFLITRRPHPVLGEEVVLMVEGTVEDGFLERCKTWLPRYWAPRHVMTVGRLPMTATGKPARADAQRLVLQR